jgi:3-oxoacyl-[acyl-carrier protein] reductase
MGYPVLINYHSRKEAAEQTRTLIEEKGGSAELLPFDTANGKETDEVFTQWQDEHPGDSVAVLVNNAGIRMDNLLLFMQNEHWHQVVDTSLNGFFYLTRRALKDMLANRWGRIITISSLSGIKGLAGQTNYSAAKAALIGASKALAQEVAPRMVTVNVVAPGFIATDMTKDMEEKNLKALIPARRFGQPEEVADLVGFLASDRAAYITGEVISINGGLYT